MSPEAYDEDYFLHRCGGSESWQESGGKEIAGMYAGLLGLAGMKPGDLVVDVGTGRGDLVVAAAEMGASRAIGFDYSQTAVDLARKSLAAHDVTDRAEVHVVDARRIPIDDDTADLVTLLDVVEHLSPTELDGVMAECVRILKPGGKVFIHTMPNRTFYEVTYKLHRRVARLFGQKLALDPRNEHEILMHVNEQTVSSLRGVLKRAGLVAIDAHVGNFLYLDIFPNGRRLYRKARRIPGLRRLVIADLYASGHKDSR